jgi:hypothetical protein
MEGNCAGQSTCQVAVKPKLELFDKPIWWHHHGIKARVFRIGSELILGSGAVQLIIGKPAMLFRQNSSESRAACKVNWIIHQSLVDRANGQTHIDVVSLEVAFGLSNAALLSDKTSQWLLDQFGGTRASQGDFINYHGQYYPEQVVYLNIPCPGTGHDGDPNISILVTDEIKEAVAEHLARAG